VTLLAMHLKLADGAPVTLRNLWTKETLTFTGEKAFTLAPHETLVFEANGKRQLENGVYLSEIPGSINVAVDGTRQPQLDPTVHRMIDPWSSTRSGGSRPQYAGWGGAQPDATPFGQSLQVAGQVFTSGLGVLSNSRLQVKNDARYARLTASVGVDDSTENTGKLVRFYVYGDGKLLAESAPARFGSKVQALTADVRGVKVIELVVREAKTGSAVPVVATWGDVQLTQGGSTVPGPRTSGSDRT